MILERSTVSASRHVIYWAATECAVQQSGEMSVAWMIDGWAYALKKMRAIPTVADIIELGRRIEPRVNRQGFRRGDVQVAGCNKLSPALVPRNLAALLDAWRRLAPDQWYKEYEDIHPFMDGNGRTGNILWNWRRATLPSPIAPPDLWAAEVVTDVEALKRMRRSR